MIHGTVSHDKTEFFNLAKDTPLGPPGAEECREMRPGTCVKSYDQELNDAIELGAERLAAGMPSCGRVQKNEEDGCVVIGHGWSDEPWERFIWKGTKQEFNRTWEID